MNSSDLRILIRYHQDLYYNGETEIDDHEFDKLMEELRGLEVDGAPPDSPTQTTGVPPILGDATHSIPMLSLENVYSVEEAAEWMVEDTEYVAELKLDGISLSLTYVGGKLFRIATRGNGKVGMDVTHNLGMVRNIPCTIITPFILEIRGELVMSHAEFQRINDANTSGTLSNPRNAVAGIMMRKEQEQVPTLDFLAYDVKHPGLLWQDQILEWLEDEGFSVSEHSSIIDSTTVGGKYSTILALRNTLDYDIDGIVLKVNDVEVREEMGATSNHPKWAVALKFPAEQVTTRVDAVAWQVGRSGVLTPVAELRAVEIGGVVVRRATLHNIDEIRRLGVLIGDTVVLERAGDVIPKIRMVVKSRRDGEELPIVVPTECPTCRGEIGGNPPSCTNSSCPSNIVANITHFVGRDAMDIRGLGGRTLEKLVKAGLLRSPADLYTLTVEALEGMEGMGEKSINNLLHSIEVSKDRGLHQIIHTIGIPQVGDHLGVILSTKYHSIEELCEATIEDLLELDDVGPIIAQSIVEFLQWDYALSEITKFRALGVKLTADTIVQDGSTYVLTGTLSRPRKEIEEWIVAHGGKIGRTVGQSTDYLVAGEKAGSKLDKARALGVCILNEDELGNILGGT